MGIMVIFTTTFLVGCATTPRLEPGAQHIKVVASRNAPNGCQLRGKVGISKTDIYGPSHKSVQEEQLAILQNQAARLGANAIILTSHKTKYYEHPEYIPSEGKMQWELDAHAMGGLAYRCTPAALNRLSLKASSNVSDVRPQDE
jgi:uncharacterized protein YbjQ (UPF0145 family)